MADSKYLDKRHQTWFCVVYVPRALQAVLGHKLSRSLKTHSLKEAQEQRHAVVAEFQASIKAAHEIVNNGDTEAIAKALEARRVLQNASDAPSPDPDDPETQRDLIESVIETLAEEIEEKHGSKQATNFYNIATSSDLLVSQALKQWKAEMGSGYDPHSLLQFQRAFDRFQKWSDKLMMVGEVDRRYAGRFISEYLNVQGLSRATINRYVSHLSIAWMWMTQRGIAENNVWRDQAYSKKKAKGGVRRAWPEGDLVKLLSGTYSRRYHRVIHEMTRLALVTGARENELCSLLRADVIEDGDELSINIREGKTEAATRIVPLHPLIVPIIRKRLEDTKGKWLFDELKPGGPNKKRSALFQKAFGNYRRNTLKITTRLQDFHALRTTFIEAMEGAEVPESTVKLIVGHKRESMTFGRYSKGVLVDLRKAIGKLSYPKDVMKLIGKYVQVSGEN